MTGKPTKGSGSGARGLTVKVRTAKKRSNSSARWLDRQLNDPWVAEAKRLGYRSRAAFKLIQIDEKVGILRRGARVVDLGAAPGGWTQIAAERVGPAGRVVGIDYLGMDPVPGAEVLKLDFLDESAPDQLRALLGGPADLVLSDMAAPTTGHSQTDHIRIVTLAEAALEFALTVLAPGGTFVAKLFQGGAEKTLLDALKRNFAKVRNLKPPASRSDSAEAYVVATGFRGEAR
jgi:23S rRNA (uridine2552-2'-O)-methyltransferase